MIYSVRIHKDGASEVVAVIADSMLEAHQALHAFGYAFDWRCTVAIG